MNDSFGLAAFRSRTQVLRMEDALHRAGLSAGVIATPREVAIGCGLSVRFDLAQTPQVMQVYRRLNPGALIGFIALLLVVLLAMARAICRSRRCLKSGDASSIIKEIQGVLPRPCQEPHVLGFPDLLCVYQCQGEIRQ